VEVKTLPFDVAYDSYYKMINTALKAGLKVLEIGGGGHPSVADSANNDYTIVDPDVSELAKAPDAIRKINLPVEEVKSENEYDLIISKMVLEHIENPEAFHRHVYKLLSPGGKAIHFFACRHSLPALVNRLLPEYVGDLILKWLGNRNLQDSPKYQAFYRRTSAFNHSQVNFFEKIGFRIEKYYSFVGHKYFRKVPVLGFLEKQYSKALLQMNIKAISTVALIVLQKES